MPPTVPTTVAVGASFTAEIVTTLVAVVAGLPLLSMTVMPTLRVSLVPPAVGSSCVAPALNPAVWIMLRYEFVLDALTPLTVKVATPPVTDTE